jgi:hypothetical protein
LYQLGDRYPDEVKCENSLSNGFLLNSLIHHAVMITGFHHAVETLKRPRDAYVSRHERTGKGARLSDCPNVRNEKSKPDGLGVSPRDCALHAFQNMTHSMMFCLDVTQELLLFNCEAIHGSQLTCACNSDQLDQTHLTVIRHSHRIAFRVLLNFFT